MYVEYYCTRMDGGTVGINPTVASSAMSQTYTEDSPRTKYCCRPWIDGTAHVMFEPFDFLARLCALVSAPHRNLVTYHGVLVSHAEWRASVGRVTPAQ